jgi:hypothetical protein
MPDNDEILHHRVDIDMGGVPEEEGEFGELLKYTLTGFVGGFILGAILDYFGYRFSAVGQWAVRTISGEGESIFEGIYSLRKRIRRAAGSLSEAYGWGKFLGMMFPWLVDWSSRLAGVDVYGVEGFYIPYFYAMSDQIGATVAGFLFLRRRRGSVLRTFPAYFGHPVMLTSFLIIIIVPVGLLLVRLAGFSPTSQKLTALETILANLCWLPPFVGWLHERKRARRK